MFDIGVACKELSNYTRYLQVSKKKIITKSFNFLLHSESKNDGPIHKIIL